MKPNTVIIFIAVIIAMGFAALLYFQNMQTQAISNALNGIAPQPSAAAPQTVLSATPPQGGLPSQQILVLGGSVPAGTIPSTTK